MRKNTRCKNCFCNKVVIERIIQFIAQSVPDENTDFPLWYFKNFMYTENHITHVVENKAAYSELNIYIYI